MTGLVAGCGEPLLPADYAGPPAAAVGGSVIRSENVLYTEARAPRLSVVWLVTLEPEGGVGALVGQSLSYRRSQHLQKDWDIGLDVPQSAARLRMNMGTTNAHMAIGKVVYFDDHDGDGLLDWSCSQRDCDQVKAISSEYVVYVNGPVTCETRTANGLELTARLSAGFHYFELQEPGPIERPRGADLRFVIEDRPAAAADPTPGLQSFTRALERTYRLGALGGC
ncbi:MAG: hypothetical protein KA712_20105 [Myxococcales bacterium]|nr:hypothetical protein [Myxococcales bacterium]